MKLEVKTIQLSDIVPQIYRADYFPFRPNERIGPRKSFVHSFVYIYEGKGSITIGTTVYSCTREELYYIPPGLPHSFHADHQHPMVHASIYFDWINTIPRVGDMSLFHFGDQICDPSECSPNVIFQDMPTIPTKVQAPKQMRWMELYLHVIENIEQTQDDAKLFRRAAFEQFVSELANLWRNPTLKSDRRMQSIMKQMKEFPQHNISIEKWASQLGISTSYLHKLFIQEIGMSPHSYAIKCKLERAKKILRETNLSITDITEDLGFGSIHYFSRLFTQNFGESPSAYRNRLRKGY